MILGTYRIRTCVRYLTITPLSNVEWHYGKPSVVDNYLIDEKSTEELNNTRILKNNKLEKTSLFNLKDNDIIAIEDNIYIILNII